jgi:NAD(P)H-dependent FMN reductase
MHIVFMSGSHRQNSQSLRVTKYLAARLPVLDSTTTTDIIDLTGNPLPLWDDENGSYSTSPTLLKEWQPYSDRLQKADGFVVTSPEWHGMVPAGLKNFFLYCSVKDTGHKPALIATVSVSRGGSYPVAELRMSSYKNNRLCYIPEHLIVREATNKFAGDAPANKDDEFMRDRADFALRVLLDYAKALKTVRENGALYEKKYASGM